MRFKLFRQRTGVPVSELALGTGMQSLGRRTDPMVH